MGVNMRKLLIGAGLAALFAGSPALAVESIGGGGCASDLTFSGASALESCYGRFSGNVLNNGGPSPGNNFRINTALDALGYLGPDIAYSTVPAAQKIDLTSPSGAIVNFPGVLNGTVFIGIHSGTANGDMGVGNQTSFYRINAVNLDSFIFNPGGGSGATMFALVPTAVPEPTIWAMMILGFGMIGTALRRRKVRVSFA